MTDESDTDYYDKCPILSEQTKVIMDADLTLPELLTALMSCSDSAPGSDGIPYSLYNKLWTITGPIILSAWNYSCETGVQPESHRESIIVLLPKEGKDLSDINNWRPITLSNCDSKIITKALVIRMSKVLGEISQESLISRNV